MEKGCVNSIFRTSVKATAGNTFNLSDFHTTFMVKSNLKTTSLTNFNHISRSKNKISTHELKKMFLGSFFLQKLPRIQFCNTNKFLESYILFSICLKTTKCQISADEII